MPQIPSVLPPSVLIVEPSCDNREVLRTALQRRGLRIFEAAGGQAGLQLAREHHPDVIVLDLEAGPAEDAWQQQFDAESAGRGSSLIILGKLRTSQRLPDDQVIAKPYHFAPLIHKIEQLAAKAA